MLDAWDFYVKSLIKGNKTKDLVDEEQDDFAEYIFQSLTDQSDGEDVAMLRDSIQSFMQNAISYVYECEKKSWTIYIILFNLKVLSRVLSICQKKIDDPKIKERSKLII